MTTSEPSRLDRIEQILEQLALRSETTDQQLASNAQQIASNARAIEANGNALAETRRLLEESGQRTEEHIQDLTQMFFSQVEQAAAERTAMREQADADRAEMRRMIEEMYGNRSNGNGNSEEE